MKKTRVCGVSSILLSGHRVWFDSADRPIVADHVWHIIHHARAQGDLWYAVTRWNGKRSVQMATVIMGILPTGLVWDHKSGNGLDNRRANLRPATKADNAHNSRGTASSGYKGVYPHSGNWRVMVRTSTGLLCLGSFQDPVHAAWTYDLWCSKHRPCARLNFPGKTAPELPEPATKQTGQLSRVHKGRYRGVSKVGDRPGWKSQIKINGINKHLGRFASAREAAVAYDAAATAAWGNLAPLNFLSRT